MSEKSKSHRPFVIALSSYFHQKKDNAVINKTLVTTLFRTILVLKISSMLPLKEIWPNNI